MKSKGWFKKQLFLLALTACVMYFAAPATDIATLYAMELLTGRMDGNTLANDAGNLFSGLKSKSRPLNRDVGPPVDVDLDSLSVERKNILTLAQSYLGTRYVYGGTSRDGIDCSGLVQQVFSQQKIALPRTAYQQFQVGKSIQRNELLPGDLIFFHTDFHKRGPTHVGIYVGNQHFLHSPKTGSVVKTSNINRQYYRRRYMGARRVVQES